MRTFVSINLPPGIKQQLNGVTREIKALLTNRELSSMRWESSEKLHITLFFIGDITSGELNRVKNSLNSIDYNKGKLALDLHSIGAFPDLRSPRVLFANIIDDGKLLQLAESVHKQMYDLGFESDKKFHPHITLGRVKRDRKVNLTRLSEMKFDIKFEAEAFYLMESKLKPTGSVYSKRERFEL